MNVLLSYLKFWWHSKNEHGVHSPFVFDLVTKCFYDRTSHSAYQQLSKNNSKSKFLIRLSAYFKFDNCFVSETIQTEFKQALNLENQTILIKTTKDLLTSDFVVSKTPCLICLDFDTIEAHSLSDLFQVLHKDSLILIPCIRKTKIQLKRWSQLKSQSEVSASIDTFYWGLLFFRTEQPKEHFTIRL